jgi:hypothetical protein
MDIMFALFLLCVSLTQSTTAPLRTGDVARELTEQDIAALEFVLPSAAKPWLLNGDPSQVGRKQQYIEAFLSPTTTTSRLRRGPIIRVTRQNDPPTAWTVHWTGLYAQVAIPGRTFAEIQGDQDMNRPFRVIGRFDDTELIRLVEFLRSNPPTRGGEATAIRPWPILVIVRQADNSVEVMLRGAVMQGQAITLRQAGEDWVILGVGMWAA